MTFATNQEATTKGGAGGTDYTPKSGLEASALEEADKDATIDPPASSGQSPVVTLIRNLLISAAIALLVGIVWFNWQSVKEIVTLLGDQERVSAYLRSFGALGPLVLALMQMIQVMFAFIPGHVFLVAGGYVYGFPLGLLMNITYTVTASQLCFLLARRLGMPLVRRLVPADTLDRWQAVGKRQGFTFFLIAFVLPVFPSDAMNFVAGVSGVSASHFLAANFLGRLPGAIILTLIGSHGLEMSTTTWGIIAALVVGIYIGGRVAISRLESRQARETTHSTTD